MGFAVLVLVIFVLAVARLTRLVNGDTILDPLRIWVVARQRHAKEQAGYALGTAGAATVAMWQRRADRWGTLNYFIQCPWCVGMWLSLGFAIIPVRLIGWPWWAFLPVALACSHLVGVFARFADTEEIDIEDVEASGDT